MKETIYALALVLGCIGLTLFLVAGNQYDRNYKTYWNYMSRTGN